MDCRGLSVLELGAGSGVSGLAAWQSGATSVCLTDLEANLPRLHKVVASEHGVTSICVEALDWTRPLPDSIATAHWDVVLCADLVFWPTLFDPLLDTLKALRSGRRGLRILLCTCDRRAGGRRAHTDFAQRAVERGWTLRQLPVREEHLQFADEGEPEPRLYEMLRQERASRKCTVS